MRRALLIAVFSAAILTAGNQTALDRYVSSPDPSYRFSVVQTIAGDTYRVHVLEMTSQTWRSAAEVNRPEWRHWVTIIKPNELKHSTGLLFITGGANGPNPPAQPPANLTSIAVDTGTVVAELRMVPNQPLIFAGETQGRVEDELIAYTWNKFLRGGDDRWPARLPMTKSAVRAMDTVTAFCASDAGGKVVVDKFVVSGASKRGWTTWTTAAVDKRVTGIIPIVIDLLNVQASFRHHWKAYGFWAPAIKNYVDMKIIDWQGTPEYRALMKIEDPYEYRDRLTIPKYVVNATGDQFFLPDSSQFYFDDLRGEKYLRYVPNSEHSMRGTDAFENVHAFYDALVNKRERPQVAWKFEKNGIVRVKASGAPSSVKLWQAANPKARDFRVDTIGRVWKDSPVQRGKDGEWMAQAGKPDAGWLAYFVELTYPTGGKYPLKVTTAVRVVPDVLPYPPFHPTPPQRVQRSTYTSDQ